MATRYAALHQDPHGPGDQRPTALQIIQDEGLEGKLVGKAVLITGCSSGLGIETSRALFRTGATLYLTARDLEKAKTALPEIISSDRVHLLQLDLESLQSVRECAAQFLSQCTSLNILICNAGVMTPPEGRTKDGFETQIGTNHIAHFLLFQLLLSSLLAASTPEVHSRVVLLSSAGHRAGQVDFDNINFEGKYQPMLAYAASKTANIWMANEIERRYSSKGLHAWSLQPGAILTNLSRHLTDEQKHGLLDDPYLAKTFKSPEQGAATTVWAAVASALEGQGGKYLDNCQIAEQYDPSGEQWGPGYAPHAYDVDKAIKLWEKSFEWAGI